MSARGWAVADTVTPLVLAGLLAALLPGWVLALLAWAACSVGAALLWGRAARLGGADE